MIVVVSGHTHPMATTPTSRTNSQVTQNHPDHARPVRSSSAPLQAITVSSKVNVEMLNSSQR